MMMPDSAQSTMKTVVDWIAENLGWFYVVTVTVVIGFVLWVALSRRAASGSARTTPARSTTSSLGSRCSSPQASASTCSSTR